MSIALSDGGNILDTRNLKSSQSHCEKIIPEIDALLKGQNLEIKQVACIACVTGPGSYTGLRIGIATAMGLAQPHGIPTAGVSSLQAMAFALRKHGVPVCPVMDAKMKQIYTALIKYRRDEPEYLKPEQSVDPEDFFAGLDGEVIFTGSDVDTFKSLILKHVAVTPRFETADISVAESAAMITAARIEKQGLIDHGLKPNYLRESAAEIRKKRG
jgi:tRNA threonylcarbamoyladenosine biosynthesis protein TsaB